MKKLLNKCVNWCKCFGKKEYSWVVLDPPEARRVYYFSRDGVACHNDFQGNYDVVVLKDIVKIKVTSTTHRLEDKNGAKYIVKNDFKFIEIDTPNWTF